MWHYILIILKKINQKALLPTRDALYLIQKAYHKSFFWKWANLSKSIISEPTKFGWELGNESNDRYSEVENNSHD